MPMEKLSMRKIREILRLRYENGCNHREISRSVGASPSTVSAYLRQAKMVGLNWPIPKELDEDQLYACLFPPAPASDKNQRALHYYCCGTIIVVSTRQAMGIVDSVSFIVSSWVSSNQA